MFTRLREKLGKTRQTISGALADLVLGKQAIDADLLEELETHLLTADVGMEVTSRIIGDLDERLKRNEISDAGKVFAALRGEMLDILKPCSVPLAIPADVRPFCILVVGVNGSGKTTTIGKLARQYCDQGHSVMLAAGDTFRAAAVEQLEAWGERNQVPVIAQKQSQDPAAVIFDAMQSARARNIDILIADTAGRLHSQSSLMEELKKIKRVMQKHDAGAPHEILLVIDGGTGQNALAQAEQFNAAVGVTGLVLTKLDGTAKGGIIFAIADKLGIPIRFIGVGEGIEDLRPFDAEEFCDALTPGEPA